MPPYNPGPICECGDPKFQHAMNMRTFQCTGRCYRGQYGPRGEWVGKGCTCMKFKKKSGVKKDV